MSSVDLNKTIKDGGSTVGFWIIKVMTPIWNYLLSFVHLVIIRFSTFESSKSISSFEITLWPQFTWFIKDHISFGKYFWIIEDWGDIQNPYIHMKPPLANIKNGCQLPCSSFIYLFCIRVQFENSSTPLETFGCKTRWVIYWFPLDRNLVSYHIRPILLLYSIWKYITCRGTPASGWGI